MKRIIGLVIVLSFVLVSVPQVSRAQIAPCVGVVIREPFGNVGMPVMVEPSWGSLWSGYNVRAGDLVSVTETHYRRGLGDVWYHIGGGWLQAWSGYTTGITQVILADVFCAEDLPHSVGD